MKGYLTAYAEYSQKQKHLETELSKLPKPPRNSFDSDKNKRSLESEESFGSFDSNKSKDTFENGTQHKTQNGTEIFSDTLRNSTVKTAKTSILESETSLNRTAKTAKTPDLCPLCQSKLSVADTLALLVRFCSFGREFTWQAFADWDAAYDLAKQMFEAASYDECAAMTDALSERAAIFMTENGFEPEDAIRAAESDLIPRWLDEFQLKNKSKIETNNVKNAA